MESNYDSQSTPELLHALEYAGRIPDLDLIREILARREEVTPGLLQMLEGGTESHWEDDDPRWYREIHAGLLLIAFREARAIPHFIQILRDPEKQTLLEWFEQELGVYGVEIIQPLKELLRDQNTYPWGRIAAGEILEDIARTEPMERAHIIMALRDALPALDSDGNLILPPSKEEDEPPYLWTWAALNLAHLHDLDSRP